MDPLPSLDFLRVATPTLNALVHQYEQTLPKADVSDFIAHLRTVSAEYVASLTRHRPGPARAREAHRLIEREMREIRGVQMTCSRGCAACCHLEVEVTSDEGTLLAEVVKGGMVIDRDRVQEQAALLDRAAVGEFDAAARVSAARP